MKILIAAPFLNNIGGTEIETIITAKFFAEKKEVQVVEIFSPNPASVDLFQNLHLNKKIYFSNYPTFFKTRFSKSLDAKITSLAKNKYSKIHSLYWMRRKKDKIKKVYLITPSNHNYIFPIINAFHNKKVLVKYTTVYLQDLEEWKKSILAKVHYNIVTSNNQKRFFEENLGLQNVVAKDVFISNEEEFISIKEQEKKYTFGIISRFSREKRLEHAILLVAELKTLGHNPKLIIRGDGEKVYYDELQQLILKKHLVKNIDLKMERIQLNQRAEFFGNISFFLITSLFEGGPTTGLEAMAAGIPVVSYNIGAMKDRLEGFPYLIANNFEELVSKSKLILEMDNLEYLKLSKSIRNHYLNKYLNKNKAQELFDMV